MPAVFHEDRPSADVGLAVTVVAVTVVSLLWSVGYGLIVVGAFATWFLLALVIIRSGGARGRNTFARAYIATFGWGNWF
ncbi:hypothetical protein GCM10010365_63510 [Streptomyces poonensis]|uniref:Uncharacterized protein n=2 Tax=Streptomyces poonensis TaxID=68255 RepID=A0A918Q6K6_9ACTN|nr:hypothetical protein GCM10010365_63510 [Streptomyces poonensis]